MSYQTRRALAQIDLFAELSDKTLDELAQRGTTFSTAAGQRVMEQGAADLGLQVVLEGSAEVAVNGEARPTMGPGDYLGEISMIDGAPRSASVVAGPDGVTTFRLSALAFAPIMETPEVSRVLLKALCTRIRALEADTASAS